MAYVHGLGARRTSIAVDGDERSAVRRRARPVGQNKKPRTLSRSGLHCVLRNNLGRTFPNPTSQAPFVMSREVCTTNARCQRFTNERRWIHHRGHWMEQIVFQEFPDVQYPSRNLRVTLVSYTNSTDNKIRPA